MAIYHLSAQVISRGKGRSCVAAAAYRAGARLADERQGLTHDYSRRRDVRETFILAPEGAPAWVYDRQALWTAVDAAEKRHDARTAREVEVALPRELTPDQQRQVVQAFVEAAFVERGMVADVAIHEGHDPGEPNPHAHILLTTRALTADGFGPKVRAWDARDLLIAWRKQWEHVCNEALAAYGHTARIDARSLKAQGIDRTPTIHEGPIARRMARRGQDADRVAINAGIRAMAAYDAVARELHAVRQEQARLADPRVQWADVEAWLTEEAQRSPSLREDVVRVLTQELADAREHIEREEQARLVKPQEDRLAAIDDQLRVLRRRDEAEAVVQSYGWLRRVRDRAGYRAACEARDALRHQTAGWDAEALRAERGRVQAELPKARQAVAAAVRKRLEAAIPVAEEIQSIHQGLTEQAAQTGARVPSAAELVWVGLKAIIQQRSAPLPTRAEPARQRVMPAWEADEEREYGD